LIINKKQFNIDARSGKSVINIYIKGIYQYNLIA